MGGSRIMASAGRVLPLPKGTYSSTTTYHLLDFVSYQGSTYICKQTSTGNAPTNTTYWQIMAQGTESASVAGNYYGTCSTGASTSAKIVSIPATENFVLQVGDIIGIKFDNTNTANNPSLNVNNSGAKPIYYNNSAVSTSNLWASGEANRVTIFMYDGTNWIWMGHDVDIDTDTLSDLKDTTISSASNGQVLMYDSTSNKWKNQTPTTTLAGLSDTQISSATDGQVLKYNSTSQKWVNGEDKGGILPHLIVISETGSTVTVVKGGTTITATETSTGHYECDVPEFGTWTIHAVLNGDDATVNLVVDTVKVYTVDDSHFHADITVKYPSGATCNLAGQGESYYATGSPYTFTVHHAGSYTITVVYDGQTYTETVTVTTTGETFSKVVPSPSSVPANDIDWWLWFGGVSGSYSTLADILADSTALATLTASTDAVDYLVRCKGWITSKALVPIMTSDTTPRGEAFGLTPASGNQAYKAFDNNSSTFYAETNLSSGSGAYVGYDFKKLVNIKKIDVIYYNLPSTAVAKVQYYNSDNDTWVDASDELTILANGVLQSFNINTDAKSTKWRLYKVSSAYSGGDRFPICTLQFYSSQESECITENQSAMSYIGLNNYCANTLLADSDWLDGIANSTYMESVLNVKVPAMTSDTTPSGVCSASSVHSGYTEKKAYMAFDNNKTEGNGWWSNASTNQYVQYDFGTAKHIYKFNIIPEYISSHLRVKNYKIQGSNNGSSFTDLFTGIFSSDSSQYQDHFNILTTNGSYRYYRCLVVDNYSTLSCAVCELQFYGREDV